MENNDNQNNGNEQNDQVENLIEVHQELIQHIPVEEQIVFEELQQIEPLHGAVANIIENVEPQAPPEPVHPQNPIQPHQAPPQAGPSNNNPHKKTNGESHQSRKQSKQVPIYIAEDHHRVVEFIHQMIKKKCLPLLDNTFIHLDSHPDMLIPKDMPAQYAYEPHKLYESHDIENWIIPNCYNGIIRHIVWVRPPWATQIRNKNQKFFVGKCRETGTIRVECRENYYIAEGLFRPKGQLEDVKDVTLDCLTLGNQIVSDSDNVDEMRCLSKTIDKNAVILDIDLDFFSTQNPFLNLYDKASLYQRLQSIFAFTCPEDYTDVEIVKAQEKRLSQLTEIEKLFNHLAKFKKLPDFEGADPDPLYAKVTSLVGALTEFYPIEDIEWDLIYSAGCTIDDHELPHHVSTDEEIDILLESFSKYLDTFPEPPKIITVSRSSSDDYTPLEQVDEIQEKVLGLLDSKFNCSVPILAYLEEKSEIEDLDDSPGKVEDDGDVS